MVQNEINSLCLSRSRQSSSVASSSTDRAHPSSRKVCRNADAGTPGVERTAVPTTCSSSRTGNRRSIDQ